MKYDLHGLIIN